MSNIQVQIKNMYGINKIENGITFNTKKKHNIIYGYNAVGKSSFAKSLIHIVTQKPYKKLLDTDTGDFLLKLKFDDIDITYDNNNEIYDYKINNKVFIFDKDYAKKNLKLDNNTGGYPEMGIRINEMDNLKESVLNISDATQKELKKKMKIIFGNNTKATFLESSLLCNVTSTDISKTENYIIEINKRKKIDNNNYNSYDIPVNSINSYKMFKDITENIEDDIIMKIKQMNLENEYKIDSLQSKEFYETVVNYLTNKDLQKCPICLNDNFDKEDIKNKIEMALNSVIDEDFKKNISTINNNLKDIDTELSNEIKDNINLILSGDINLEKLKATSFKINYLVDNYDELAYSFINIDLAKQSNDIVDFNKTIQEIEEQNEELKELDFIINFDKMLKHIFTNNELQAKTIPNQEESTVGIKLIFDGKEKENKTIDSFYSEVLSESQKTKMSLAFFFAIILTKTKNSNDKEILCIFDDPIDSYDSINKYELSRLIYNFIEKKSIFFNETYNCNSIILTHSVDYLRLSSANFINDEKKEVSYHVLSQNSIIEELDEDKLFLFDGDFEILKKMQSSGKTLSVNELLSCIAIIRTLADYSSKSFKSNGNGLNVNNKFVKELFANISEDITHGLFRSKCTVKILLDLLNNYTDVNVDLSGINDSDKLLDVYKKIIGDNRQNTLNFYDSIIVKNIISSYIRAAFDEILMKILAENILMDKSIANIQKDNPMLGNKLREISFHKDVENKYKNIIVFINDNLNLLNEFGHSANLFLTPIIDVPIEKLYKVIDEYKKLKYDNKTIGDIIIL